MKNILTRILKIGVYTTAGLLLVILLFALFTQTQFFRDRLRVILASSIASKINGSLHIGRIDGNLLYGFTIDSMAISYGEETILNTGKILFQYDPIGLLRNNLKLHSIVIEQPTIHIVRPQAGDWNIASLMKHDSGTSQGAFDWTLVFENIELKNASIFVTDSVALTSADHWNLPATYFEYHKFSAHDVNIRMSAEINGNNIIAKISHASCYSPESQFELSHFKGDFSITDHGTRVQNMIIQTGHSYIELDASMSNLNLLHGLSLEKLQHDSTHVQLRAKNLDLSELRSFLPQVYFLNGSVFVDMEASGEFGNLLVKHLHLNTYGSTMNLSGNVRNLHRPEDLTLNVIIGDTKINPADVSALLPPFGIPSFDSVGQVTLFSEFIGKPLNFTTRTSVKGTFGEFTVNGGLNLENTAPTYRGTFNTHRLNLGPIVGIKRFRTLLNGNGSIAGKGFTLDDLTSSLSIVVDSSRIQGLSLSSSEISFKTQPQHIDASAIIRGQEMKAEVHGQGDFTNSAIPQYSGTFSLFSFDLAKLFDDPEYTSSLTLHGTASMSGHEIDDFNVESDISLLPSMFQGHEVQRQDIHLSLDQHRTDQKRLSLQSGIADIDFNGTFDLDQTTSILLHHANNLIETIKQHAMPADSQHAGGAAARFAIRPYSKAEQKFNCTYNVNIKNLAPIAELFKGSPFDAKARLKGSLVGTNDSLSLLCKGSFDEFYVGTVRGGVLLNNGLVAIELHSLKETQILENLVASARLTAQSGRINTERMDWLSFEGAYRNLAGTFRCASVIDSTYSIQSSGNISVQPHTYVFDFDTLNLGLRNYIWQNEQDVQCRWDYDGFRIMRGTMKRNDEALSINGIVHPDGEFEAIASLKNFDLTGVNIISQNPELSSPGQGFTGIANADLRLSGSTASPVISLTSSLNNTYFRQTRIGTVHARIDYSDQLAALDFVVRTSPSDTIPSLIVKGTLPINLALSGVEERFPDKEQHVQIVSDGFDVSVLDPLLRDVDNLSGTIRSNVLLAGTTQNPSYNGAITLSNIQFLFGPNNIAYNVSGDLLPTENKILVHNLLVHNLPYRGKIGETSFNGSVSMKNFQFGEFDLNGKGQFLLMTEATRKQVPTMYGTLFTDLGPDGLSITGTLDRPYLSGTLFVLDANLIFPPATTVLPTNSNLTLQYVLVDDTTKVLQQEQQLSKFYRSTDTLTFRDARNNRERSSPLLDRLRYSLNVETQGITAVKMIFTPATNEELYAELTGKVVAVNNQGIPTIYGEIEIAPRSYYNFFKKFDATGKLKFIGPWDNPELDIKARYEGVRQVSESQLREQQNVNGGEQRTTEQKVIVELTIKGPRLNPKLEMSMKVQSHAGGVYEDWSSQSRGGDVQSDVISFIVTGKFRDQLTAKDQQEITNIGSTTGTSVASSLLSGIFSDYLRQEFSFVRSVDVNYRGGSFTEGTNVNITASAGIGQLRVGGKIFNDLGNTNLTYQVNLVRNLFLEIQRKVNSDYTEDKRLTNEARLYYRFSF